MKRGGTRKVKIRKNHGSSPKTYNVYRGKTGTYYGHNTFTGKHIVDIGNGNGIAINAENLEYLDNAPSKSSMPCERCKLVPANLTEEGLFTGVERKINNLVPNNYVEQDTFRLTNSNRPIYTYGLATCSALSLNIGKKQFLTHLSSNTDIRPIIQALRAELRGGAPITNVKIFAGVGSNITERILLNDPSQASLALAYKILDALRVPRESAKVESVCYAEIVP